MNRTPSPKLQGPVHPLHSDIRLRGQRWRIAGIIQSLDHHGGRYTEYQLRDGQGRTLTLEEENGNWSLLRALDPGARVRVDARARHAQLYGLRFPHGSDHRLTVTAAAGEFDAPVTVGDVTDYAYFEGTDYDLCAERTDRGGYAHWLAYYPLDEDEIEFHVDAALQKRLTHDAETRVLKDALVFMVLAVLIFVLFANLDPQAEVYRSGERRVGSDHEWVSEPFTLSGRTHNVLAQVDTNLNNDWLFLELSLVNQDTGKRYVRAQEFAYFSGVEGGEHWSEGAPREELFFAAVPGGRYVVEVTALADKPGLSYRFTLTRGVTRVLYLLLALGTLGVIPLLIMLRRLHWY